MCDPLVVRNNAKITVGKSRKLLRKGEVLCACDPLVAGREHLFRPLAVQHYCNTRRSAPVETATAEPGEKRQVAPSVKSSKRKSDEESGSADD